MRRIAIINQKGGVGKTTTTANLGAALAIQGRRVVVVDMDAQANLSLSLGIEAKSGSPTSYTVLTGATKFAQSIRPTAVPRLSIVPANIDLSGAELELAAAMGREFILRDAIREWAEDERKRTGQAPADYVLFDCPPSLGLLSINALASAGEVLITLQTEFLALQGMSKLVEVVQLLKKRLNPELVVTGIIPCLYDSRLRLAREVLGEIRTYFKGQVFPHPVRSNVKLAEAPSFGQTVFEYAPDSNGADDYMRVAREVVAREGRDPELAGLPAFDEKAHFPLKEVTPPRKPPPRPPSRKPAAETPTIAPANERGAAAPAPQLAQSGQSALPASLASDARDSGVRESSTGESSAGKSSAGESSAGESSAGESSAGKSSAGKSSASKSSARESAGRETVARAPSALSVTAPAVKERAQPASVREPRDNVTPRSSADPVAATAASDAQESATDAPKNGASAARAPARDATSSEGPPRDARTPPAKPATRTESRVLRAEDVPPLPPDAFEILSILPSDS